MVAAEGLAFPDAVALVRQRGRYMQAAVEAGRGLVCALLGLERSVVTEVCRAASALGVVAPANFNAPGQIVIAGEKAAVEEAARFYFGKSIAAVDAGEAALLASLPKGPTEIDPWKHPERAKDRQRYILGQLVRCTIGHGCGPGTDAEPDRAADQ